LEERVPRPAAGLLVGRGYRRAVVGTGGTVHLLDPLSRLLNAPGRRAQSIWARPGRAHIEVRRVESSQVDKFTERLEAELCSHRAVRWVETVGELGRVVVAYDEDLADEDDFVEWVESVEEEFGAEDEPFAGGAARIPVTWSRSLAPSRSPAQPPVWAWRRLSASPGFPRSRSWETPPARWRSWSISQEFGGWSSGPWGRPRRRSARSSGMGAWSCRSRGALSGPARG
jgi:hypothetical protein